LLEENKEFDMRKIENEKEKYLCLVIKNAKIDHVKVYEDKALTVSRIVKK
jgi:hypothetical protein